jgi:DNA-binding NarL/FixJ family response regulator
MHATVPGTGATWAGVKHVLLVDDHPIVRQGLAQFIDLNADLKVCGEASGETGALEAVERRRPDAVVVDLSLRDGSGLELIRKLHEARPGLPVLVLSMHDETLHAERVLRLGARGYVMKQEATETVLAAIRKVLRGEIYLSERMASRLLGKLTGARAAAEGSAAAAALGRLSDREMQVFEMIGRGEPPREIAAKLGLSVKTVDAHRERIKEKLGLRSGNELLRYAVSYNMDRLGE